MQRAGQAASRAAWNLVQSPKADARILVLAGPGDNGGDALECAYLLASAGARVSVLLVADIDRQSAASKIALARAKGGAVQFPDPGRWSDIQAEAWTLVVDGLFGIGLTRPITGVLRELVEHVNTLACPVLALDLPSGLDADTGAVVGADGVAGVAGVALRATHTISFIANKPGLHTGQARDFAGEIQLATLDIDEHHYPTPKGRLNQFKLFKHALRSRRHDSHKGTYGDIAVLGGARGMGGAPLLAARAAAKCGAGRVFVGFVDDAPLYDAAQPELMCRSAQAIDFSSNTLVAGPGLGTCRQAHDLLAKALNSAMPLVLDADALNLIAMEPALQLKLRRRRGSTLLTPHPLEAARMLGSTTAEVRADRPKAARQLASQFNAVVVLKGSGTVIARPDGEIVINTTGNPSLATAGTGDVLAGVCGALLAQHWPVWEAALAAVWMHGAAADELVMAGAGPIGLTASELIPAIRATLNRLIKDYADARLAR